MFVGVGVGEEVGSVVATAVFASGLGLEGIGDDVPGAASGAVVVVAGEAQALKTKSRAMIAVLIRILNPELQ